MFLYANIKIRWKNDYLRDAIPIPRSEMVKSLSHYSHIKHAGNEKLSIRLADDLVKGIEAKGLVYTDTRNYLWDRIHLFVKPETDIIDEFFEGRVEVYTNG